MCGRRSCLLSVIGLVVLAAVLFGLMQLVPYGRDHTNPPPGPEPAWDSPQTRELAARACFDCHGNTTVWPWYSNIAPVSWLVQRDVDEGRRHLNFQEWGSRAGREREHEAGETVQEGSMPPWFYLIMHPNATLSAAEKQELARGLDATLGGGGFGD